MTRPRRFWRNTASPMYQPSRRQRRRRQGGSNRGVRAMSVASSTTSIKIAEKSAPSPMLPHGGHQQNEARRLRRLFHAFGNEHSGASLNAKRRSLGAMRQRAEAGQGAAPGRNITETKIIKRQRRLSKCRYISSVTRYIPRI